MLAQLKVALGDPMGRRVDIETDVLTGAGFTVESLERVVDVHLHCLAVGRKPASR